MQDLSSGEMKDLTQFLKPEIGDPDNLAQLSAKVDELTQKLQAAKDAVQPDRTKQGPVFILGEVIEIRGGKFQVTKIEHQHIRLKSLPS